ncbi:ArnT family glycosyltransferase [Litorimonas sp. RW-G-Af-16]
MAESGDWLNIRFQDEARNKKPAGAYWAQTVMLKTLSSPEKRQIWVQRLPSVIAGLLAVLLTYLAAVRMIGRQGALYAAGALAISLIFVFEGHIAKTDALLCASASAVFAALAHVRHPDPNARFKRLWVWVFWVGLGAGIMIKGPIVPALAVISILGLWVWERRLGWAKALLFWPAIILFLLIWMPWAIAIYMATDGAFFTESLGNDFGGKLVSAQEKHPGPPGYHLGLIWLTLWPSSLFLIPGAIYAVRSVRSGKGDMSAVTKAMRLCLIWVVPFWLMIEIMPTKLPHYVLPLFPALCVMIGAAIATLMQVKIFPVARFISAALFAVATTALIGALLYAQTIYGTPDMEMITYAIIGVGALAALIAAFGMVVGKAKLTVMSAVLSAIVLSCGAYGYILPNLDQFRTSERVAQTLNPVSLGDTISPTYTEPSLLYYTNKSLRLGGQADPIDMAAIREGRVIILDLKSEAQPDLLVKLQDAALADSVCLEVSEPVRGFNYSKGDKVEIVTV